MSIGTAFLLTYIDSMLMILLLLYIGWFIDCKNQHTIKEYIKYSEGICLLAFIPIINIFILLMFVLVILYNVIKNIKIK